MAFGALPKVLCRCRSSGAASKAPSRHTMWISAGSRTVCMLLRQGRVSGWLRQQYLCAQMHASIGLGSAAATIERGGCVHVERGGGACILLCRVGCVLAEGWAGASGTKGLRSVVGAMVRTRPWSSWVHVALHLTSHPHLRGSLVTCAGWCRMVHPGSIFDHSCRK